MLEALSGRRPERTPVWFMRQAGRSLPEYRALRERAGASMLDVCLWPHSAATATLQPVRRHGVDAAILFSDIMVPLRLAGVGVRIEPGIGPVLDTPVRDAAAVRCLIAHRYGQAEHVGIGADGGPLDGAAGVAAVQAAAQAVVAELGTPRRPGQAVAGAQDHSAGDESGAGAATPRQAAFGTDARSAVTGGAAPVSPRARAGLEHSRGAAAWTPLIGFGGAPFTLVAYLAEGRPSRDHLAARTLMHADPDSWEALMTWAAHLTGAFMATQIGAGAAAVQLFDSWAGSLSAADYREKVAPYSALALDVARAAVSATTGAPVPTIHFAARAAHLLPELHRTGADVVGVDECVDLSAAATALAAGTGDGPARPVQGNLNPALLGAPWEVLARGVDACLEAGRAAPAHVFNLGHGVPPSTDPNVLTRVVARVHGSQNWERTALTGWDGER
ncbi:uroporphyrinogen decarboxylase family protein [Actinomyces sp.]|uniref:uroporphyrinogen decarboxylase family protein n=1 Tax=Actinomyces sp. TaxID=29317 RepID=UPI0026DB665E|nr:uroporphyrinogen decarboxylase family protein [Actinomyces sp.]MDO4900112.1 uroporphyrinogen decarboxylase family protein [Actinomyces sp.]